MRAKFPQIIKGLEPLLESLRRPEFEALNESYAAYQHTKQTE